MPDSASCLCTSCFTSHPVGIPENALASVPEPIDAHEQNAYALAAIDPCDIALVGDSSP